jgi:superfamily II DNA or RNA helicase
MNDITKKYKKYKLKESNETMENFCLPKKFKLQPQQEFIPTYLWENKNNLNGLLLYHNIGSGKTCTAINIAEKFKKTLKIVVVLPAALIGNFRDELRSNCPNGTDTYLFTQEKNIISNLKSNDTEYQNIIKKTDERIDKYYNIYSYHKFIELLDENKIKLNNTLLIIDEIQNMISLKGVFYKTLLNAINNTNNTLKVILMSATPMFDKPSEIALTLNLLKPKILFPTGQEFNNEFISVEKIKNESIFTPINLDKFYSLSKGLISYYRGAPPQAYPKTEFSIVNCKMSDFQYKSYLTSMSRINQTTKGSFKDVDLLKVPINFFLGPRMVSNISFPNKSMGESGYASLKNELLHTKNIEEYSKKFYKIIKTIKKSEGPIFVYSNFKDIGGLKSFIKFIEYNGYKNYKVFGEGKKRYAFWSGDETHAIKEEIKHIFNQKENENGEKIKLMLGSPSIKEGVSLLRVDQVHILEPYWNLSRVQQIIGRAIRFCSHKDVIKSKQLVKVYLYIATHPKEKKTIDQYIWHLAKQKALIIQKFENILKTNAIDCQLFHARNVYKDDIIKPECNRIKYS